jgi:hypothetical protein
VFQHIMTDLNGAEWEEDRIVAIKKILLKPMKQNGCQNSQAPRAIAFNEYDHDKWQTRPLAGEGAPHRQNRNWQ